MLYPIKDRDYLENLEELVSLESQVKAVRLQDKVGKQNFYEDMKKKYSNLLLNHLKAPLKI